MIIKVFTFNAYSENTYLLYDESAECAIIDPGCYTKHEQDKLVDFVTQQNLKPVLLLNTHCHIDHVLGNNFVAKKYNLLPQYAKEEIPVLKAVVVYAPNQGFRYDESPEATTYIKEGDAICFGNIKMEIFFTPGHSPGSLSFYHQDSKTLVAGDVIFASSIGRTDLPGGDYQTLLNSIKNKLMSLPDDIRVYPGHGPSTTIGRERKSNPFLNP